MLLAPLTHNNLSGSARGGREPCVNKASRLFVGLPFRMSILTRTGERANHKRLLELLEGIRAPSKAKAYHPEVGGHAKNI
jgi:hypothetical protein